MNEKELREALGDFFKSLDDQFETKLRGQTREAREKTIEQALKVGRDSINREKERKEQTVDLWEEVKRNIKPKVGPLEKRKKELEKQREKAVDWDLKDRMQILIEALAEAIAALKKGLNEASPDTLGKEEIQRELMFPNHNNPVEVVSFDSFDQQRENSRVLWEIRSFWFHYVCEGSLPKRFFNEFCLLFLEELEQEALRKQLERGLTEHPLQ